MGGLKGTILKWFQSYLSDIKFLVKLGNFSSFVAHIYLWSPSSFNLGAVPLFFVYVTFGSTLRRDGVSLHFYADDTQSVYPDHVTRTFF